MRLAVGVAELSCPFIQDGVERLEIAASDGEAEPADNNECCWRT